MLIELASKGSLSAAARALGVTHATVGRRIGNLERDLGQPLFVRDGGGYILTQAGHRFLNIARPMADSADAIIRAAQSLEARLTGPVRITATESVGNYIVLPALGDVHALYPDLDLVLNVNQVNLNLARSDADIAVRLAAPHAGSGLVSTKIANLDYHLYASRSYVEECDGRASQYIGYPDEFSAWPEYKAFEAVSRGGRTVLRLNNLGNRIEAARLGFGIALLPQIMGSAWPDLVVVSTDVVIRREIHVVVHEDMLEVPRIKACFDAMVASIRRAMRTLREPV